MSRYDREMAFFDSLRDFGTAHPILDRILAFAIAWVGFLLFPVGPLVGALTAEALGVSVREADGLAVAVIWLGGSAACAATCLAVALINERRRRQDRTGSQVA